MLARVGPDWFQELSPQQMDSVDRLGSAILKDLRDDTIANTQDVIAELGLVLRPNHTYIAYILTHCCANPVEFLLLLYQMLDPKRKSYSLNDRLLLSAVVHLTMRETLRELHVRIPSPPPPRKMRPRRPPKKKPLPRYKSVYLFPFTFEPEPPKHTGEYKNRHIQYPESIYFSYIDELKREMEENMRGGQEGEEEGRKRRNFANVERMASKASRSTGHSEPLSDVRTFGSEIDKELDDELVAAQVKYNRLSRSKRKKPPKLLRPSVYKVCTESFGYTAGLRNQTDVSDVESYNQGQNTRLSLTVEVRIIDEYDENMQRTNTKYQYRVDVQESEQPPEESIDYFSRHVSTFIIGGVVLAKNGNVIPIITGIVPEPETICRCTYERVPIVSGVSVDETGKATKVISGVKLERLEQSDCSCKAKRHADELERKRKEEEDKQKDQVICTCKEKRTPIVSGVTMDAAGKPIRIVSGIKVERDENRVCPCKKKTPEQIEKEIEESRNKITCTCGERRIPIISGVAVDKKGKRIRILSGMRIEKSHDESCECKGRYAGKEGCHLFDATEKEAVVEEPPCTCRPMSPKNNPVKDVPDFAAKIDDDKKIVPEKLVEANALAPFHCHCQEIIEKRLAFIKMMQECEGSCNTNRLKPTFIMGGLKGDVDGGQVPVIAGVKDDTCKCLEKYNRKVKRMEDEKAKQRTMSALKSTKQTFVIGGVVPGKDGAPNYLLSGVAGEPRCPKCDALLEEQKREEERLANMPELPTGRQKYIISGVQQTPVGNQYILSGAIPMHPCDCMELYDAFVNKHFACNELFEQYMKKVQIDTDEYMSEMSENWKEPEEELECKCEDEVKDEPQLAAESSSSSTLSIPTSSSSDDIATYDETCYPCNVPEKSDSKDDTKIFVTLEIGEKKRKKICDCLEGGEPELAEVKRFIVLEKIPCDLSKQRTIIKQALKVMAMDGFPLAKLPCCHKLPHFKLWMALRCGKYWTMEDREKLWKKSKQYWNHLNTCSTKLKYPRLNISLEEAARYTWGNFKFVKRVSGDLNEKFYRKIKQGIIDDGREFYPSTFSYELPTKTFRDCYFAYVPGKEENVFSNRPWNSFEYIDYCLIRKVMHRKRNCP